MAYRDWSPLGVSQHNEQMRTLTSLVSNGGLALFGACAALIYNGDGSDDTLVMAFIGGMLMSGSMIIPKFLREET